MVERLDSTHSLQYAEISWQADGTPVSGLYGDVYFSRASGLEECRHVFLDGNRLTERWQSLVANSHFVIVETGFGTGLNFLATWQLWRDTAPAGCHLHYISIEKHPISGDQLTRGWQQWPELQVLANVLLPNYPPALPGIHQIPLEESVTLSLGFGDIIDALGDICDSDHPLLRRATAIKVDAWILDGFAPARNPDMWSTAVFQHIADLSKPGSSFATFTAAGKVKRGLAALGFEVLKVPGFGRKRDMLVGTFQGPAAEDNPALPKRLTASWHCHTPGTHQDRTALVIGAGLAGSHTARALAQSGWQVEVLEQGEHCAAAASGNPAGILYTRLAGGDSDQAAFSLNAYLYAARSYRTYMKQGLLREGEDGEMGGMLQLGYDEGERESIARIAGRYQRFPSLVQWLSAEEAASLCGLRLEHPALYFPASGWLNPSAVCHGLLDHPSISLRENHEVSDLVRNGGKWQVHASNGKSYEASICVISAGVESRMLPYLAPLPTKGVGGQITLVEGTGIGPKIPLCHSGYVSPMADNKLCCGASFRINDPASELREADHEQNLEQLARHVPTLPFTDQKRREGRASVRCTTPDYLPIIGPVPDWQPLLEEFSPLSRNARARIDNCGHYLPGLFVNTGHGSRGLSTTPIAGAVIAALANRTPRPLSWRLTRAVNPARFSIRDLVRGKKHEG